MRGLHLQSIIYGVCFFLLSCVVAHAGGHLVVGVGDQDWAGHYQWVEGELVGIDADIVRQVSKNLGYTVEFRPFPWARVISDAQDKRIDCVLDAAPTEQRQQFLYFVKTPVSVEATVFWVKKGSSFLYQGEFTPDMRIGLMHGADWSDRFAREGMPTVERFNSFDAAFSSLAAGRIDAFGGHLAPTREHVNRLGFAESLEPSLPILHGLAYYLAFTHKEGHFELAEAYSAGLKIFYESPEYEKLLDRHGGMDIRESLRAHK